jgi:hypothetical protein
LDEDNLVSLAGLAPLLGLAEQTQLPQIIAEKFSITTPRIRSGAANPVPKLLSVIAGMCAGADSIADLDVLRAGGMPILCTGVPGKRVTRPSVPEAARREDAVRGVARIATTRSWEPVVPVPPTPYLAMQPLLMYLSCNCTCPVIDLGYKRTIRCVRRPLDPPLVRVRTTSHLSTAPES